MAGYTGLATGAGAAGGLETLLARLREEEVLRQRQQQLEQTGKYQQGVMGLRTRDLDLEEAGLPSLIGQREAGARSSMANAGVDEAKLGLLKGIMPGGTGGGNMNLTGIEERNSPTRIGLRAIGITPDPLETEHVTPEWRARLEGFGPYTPQQVRESGQSPSHGFYEDLATRRENRLAADQEFRHNIAQQRLDLALKEAANDTEFPREQLIAYEIALRKRIGEEVSRPWFGGVFGGKAAFENAIDTIKSEELAKLKKPRMVGQTDIPIAVPSGVTVTRRPRVP